jgi:hypothetical protein
MDEVEQAHPGNIENSQVFRLLQRIWFISQSFKAHILRLVNSGADAIRERRRVKLADNG